MTAKDRAPTRGSVIVLSAPSGTGKSSLVRRLVQAVPELTFSISATTRPPRAGERDGVDYHFLERAEFIRRQAEGDFLEHAEVHGNLYGTLRTASEAVIASGRDLLLEIDVQGARQVDAADMGAHLVFVLPPSPEILEARLRGRGLDSEEVIARRLAAARAELAAAGSFHFAIVNDDFDEALERLVTLVRALRSSRFAMRPRVEAIVAAFGAQLDAPAAGAAAR